MSEKKEKCFLIVSGMIFALAFFGFILFINARIDFLLNSDDSSELVLGRLLASENRLLSRNWYYSTELRVVNTQIFYAFFFKLFQNWHTVRIASYICLYIVMIAAYYFMCKALTIKKYFLITAALLMIPFSEDYFSVVLKGAYYIPHIAITFFTLGFSETCIEMTNGKREKICVFAAFLCAILAGMGGARQVVVLYFPLALAAMCIIALGLSVDEGKIICVLNPEDRKYIRFSFISFAGALIGYVINTRILSKIFTFEQWDSICFQGFDVYKLQQVVNGFLTSYGYKTEKVFSTALLCNFICLCWLVLTLTACLYILKNRKRVTPSHFRLALFTVAAFATFIILYVFTDLGYGNRYNLPIIILSIPMIAVLFKNTKLQSSVNYALLTLFVLLVLCAGGLRCRDKCRVDYTAELRGIVAALQNEQYTEGYTTLWRGNVLTELSNGVIDVRVWQESEPYQHITVDSIDDTNKWLQLVAHDYTRPEGKVFLLFTTTEWENNPWKGKLSTDNVIYHSGEYMVIGYESYDKLLKDTTQQ